MKKLVITMICLLFLCSCSFTQKNTPQITPLIGQTIYYLDAVTLQWTSGVVTDEKFLYSAHHPNWYPEHVVYIDGKQRSASHVFLSMECK